MARSLDELDYIGTIQDADLMLVQQGGIGYKTKARDVKQFTRVESGDYLVLESDFGVQVKTNIYPEMTGASGSVSIRNLGSSSSQFESVYTNKIVLQQNEIRVQDTYLEIEPSVALRIKSDILPEMSGSTGFVSTRKIGTSTTKFSEIHTEELYLGPSSLYINGNKALEEDENSEIRLTGGENQPINIITNSSTVGSGPAKISVVSDNQIIIRSAGSLEQRITSASGSTKSMMFENQSANGNITFSTPHGSTVFNNDVEVAGNLIVTGTTTTMDVETVTIQDNLIQLNSGQTGIPAAGLLSGIEVNRGDYENYRFEFSENSDTFRIGQIANTQAVATRENEPLADGVAYWNDTEKRFDTTLSIPVFTKDVVFPENPKAGDECFRDDLDKFFKYTGSNWVEI